MVFSRLSLGIQPFCSQVSFIPKLYSTEHCQLTALLHRGYPSQATYNELWRPSGLAEAVWRDWRTQHSITNSFIRWGPHHSHWTDSEGGHLKSDNLNYGDCKTIQISSTVDTIKHIYLSQQPYCAVSVHEGQTLFRNFTASAFSGRTRLLFIIPPFCFAILYFPFLPLQRFSNSTRSLNFIYTTLHYLCFGAYELRSHGLHISYTHSLQSLKVLRGRHMVSKGNWLVLAGTGTDGLVLMEVMGSGVGWLIQKVVMGWALLQQI